MSPNVDAAKPASFCVTLIGFPAAEFRAVEAALGRARGSLAYATRSVPSASGSPFQPSQVHAIAFTPESLTRVTAEDEEIIRRVTALGTCRAYVVAFEDHVADWNVSWLDEFIQRSPDHSANTVAQQIISFFSESDGLNRYSTHRGIRDAACLRMYPVLAFLWTCSYIIGTLHVLNATMHVKGHELWPGVHLYPEAQQVATFFGAFFILISVAAIVRNALYSVRVMKLVSLEFPLWATFFSFLVGATAYSIASLGESEMSILVPSVLGVAGYFSYMYCRRVRGECTSLSQLRAAMDEPHRLSALVDHIGKAPLGSTAYPFFSFRSRSLFISYWHSSGWSRATAEIIRQSTHGNGFDVFLDQSSIHSGSLWRQALLRSLSECGFFVTALDVHSAASGWVLAECLYAAMLRKSIGKPRILVVIPSTEQLDLLREGPFGILFRDLFDFRHAIRDGGSILIAGNDELSEARILQALSGIRPMRLLI
jgi:hypothetical protein